MVISGPSGSGKSTLIRQALARSGPRVRLAVSATTRAPRDGERDGIDYYFVSREQFQDAIDVGDFLEWAEFAGNFYGTPRAELGRPDHAGECVLLEIEVQGALQVRAKVPDALLVWVDVPSFEALEARLRGRHTESEESVTRRLARARWELSQAHQYHERVLNDDLEKAVQDLVALLGKHGCGEVAGR